MQHSRAYDTDVVHGTARARVELLEHRSMHWHDSLAYRVTPKSGPLHSMDTLLDANRSVARHLPAGYLKREHWRNAGWALVRAAESGRPFDITAATEALVQAVECEGWMNFDREQARKARLQKHLAAGGA